MVTMETHQIVHSRGSIQALHPVLESREVGDVVIVIYDYMCFRQGEPARNLYAYSTQTGEELWCAEDVSGGANDPYVNLISESPLVVGSFAGFDCQLDIKTGKVVGKMLSR